MMKFGEFSIIFLKIKFERLIKILLFSMGRMNETPGIVKKVLHAGVCSLPIYDLNTKAFFDFEVHLPLVDVNKEGFPEDR